MVLPNGPVATSSEAEAALFDLVDVYDRTYEAAAAELSLSPAQACVLGRLGERRGMGALAEELGCDASNITQIVARLEALGLRLPRTGPPRSPRRTRLTNPQGRRGVAPRGAQQERRSRPFMASGGYVVRGGVEPPT
jgi:DNA-binding MarR family transcriptional regulator